MQILYVMTDKEETPIGCADEDNAPTVGDLVSFGDSRDGHDGLDLYEVVQRHWGYIKTPNSTGLVSTDPSVVIACDPLALDASEPPS